MRTMVLVSIDHIPEFGVNPNGKRVKTDDPGRGDVLKVVGHQYRAHDPFLSVPNSEDCVRTWISQLALPTATRILHVSDPNTAAWTFSKVGGKGTGQLLSDYAWEKKPSPNSDDVTLRRLIVEAKAPCVSSFHIYKSVFTVHFRGYAIVGVAKVCWHEKGAQGSPVPVPLPDCPNPCFPITLVTHLRGAPKFGSKRKTQREVSKW